MTWRTPVEKKNPPSHGAESRPSLPPSTYRRRGARAGTGAGCGHDRPELGAGDEAVRRGGDQPRRPDVPCRHHSPRARHPGDCWVRSCHLHPHRRRRCHRLLRRRRDRVRVQGHARVRGDDARHRRDARAAVQGHDERRQPRVGVQLCAASKRRGWPRPNRVHHQQCDWNSPQSHPRCAHAAARHPGRDRSAGPWVRLAARLFRKQAGRGRLDDRGGVLPRRRDCAAVGLQVERVPQAAVRRALRAGGGEPDAGLPRGVAVRGAIVSGLLRPGGAGDAKGARRDGPEERAADGALCADRRRGQGGA
mmetsp:Transcript_16913/g.44009  ORF Transcript_16913/g.44009 Transcript_16913/m.44009 type:complete len:306 (+) Transcript_16913:2-919(+)